MHAGDHGHNHPAALLAVLTPYVSSALGIHVIHSAWAALLIYHAAIAAVVFRRGLKPACVEACRGWSMSWGLGLALICLANGGALLLLWRFTARDPGALSEQLARLGLAQESWWLFGAWYVLVHPILEELFWRCTLTSGRFGPAFPDLAFAGYHSIVLIAFMPWYWVLPVVLLLAGMGWVWRVLVRRLGGPAVPIVSHACAGLGTIAAASILAGRIHP
jgi:membrane protease YdiL (CAAX protease family)